MRDFTSNERREMVHCLNCLSSGVDPISHASIGSDSVLCNKKIRQMLSSASQLIRELDHVHLGELVTALHASQIRLPVSAEELSISDLCVLINGSVEGASCCKIHPRTITSWLVQEAYLEEARNADGRIFRIASEQGVRLGIRTEIAKSDAGFEYYRTYYDCNACNFIFSNLVNVVSRELLG